MIYLIDPIDDVNDSFTNRAGQENVMIYLIYLIETIDYHENAIQMIFL